MIIWHSCSARNLARGRTTGVLLSEKAGLGVPSPCPEKDRKRRCLLAAAKGPCALPAMSATWPSLSTSAGAQRAGNARIAGATGISIGTAPCAGSPKPERERTA
jgi:hypothetical protein